MQNPQDTAVALFALPATRVATVLFSPSQERRTCTVKRDRHWLLYVEVDDKSAEHVFNAVSITSLFCVTTSFKSLQTHCVLCRPNPYNCFWSYSMQQSRPWKSNSRFPRQEILRRLWSQNVYYLVHKKPVWNIQLQSTHFCPVSFVCGFFYDAFSVTKTI
jgi:hypothetical protein